MCPVQFFFSCIWWKNVNSFWWLLIFCHWNKFNTFLFCLWDFVVGCGVLVCLVNLGWSPFVLSDQIRSVHCGATYFRLYMLFALSLILWAFVSELNSHHVNSILLVFVHFKWFIFLIVFFSFIHFLWSHRKDENVEKHKADPSFFWWNLIDWKQARTSSGNRRD